jgi:hypothetical protein
VWNLLLANNFYRQSLVRIFNDCQGMLNSLGFNLIEVTTNCSIQGLSPTDITGLDPLLSPLGHHGGPTFNHVLLPGSPAIEAGSPGACPSPDQRGLPRPVGSNCDIGAVEDLEDLFLPLLMR